MSGAIKPLTVVIIVRRRDNPMPKIRALMKKECQSVILTSRKMVLVA
jgi:hypothetical protein